MEEKVGDMEERIKEGRIRRTRKEMVGCVQDLVGGNNFLVQFKDGKRREMSSC